MQTELAALESADLRKIESAFIAAVAERESALWSRFTENLARAEAMAEAVKQPFVAGSTGQLTEHSGFKVAARCDELALKLWRALTDGQDEAMREDGGGEPLTRSSGHERPV